ncbi:MAG: hypothetical protein PVI40_00235 [Chlamydiota bacterium]|jgi:hypothetical protein
MRKILFSLLLSSAAFCQWKDYDVNFQDNKDSFAFTVITEKEQPSMGQLVISDLRVSLPQEGMPGVIAMDLILDPNSASLPALGPREGRFVFQKGKALPQIVDGDYEIVIDGISYGHMHVGAKDGSYFPLERVFHEE